MAQVVLLIGLPGSGKSTFANALSAKLSASNYSVEILSFDRVEQELAQAKEQPDFDPLIWKQAREQVMRRAREVVDQRCDVDSAAENVSSTEGIRRLLILDDNFYFRSMRKPYYQLARDRQVHFKQIVLQADLFLCKERNAQRSGRDRVPDFSIEQMAGAIEYPREGMIIPVVVGEGDESGEGAQDKLADAAVNQSSWERNATTILLKLTDGGSGVNDATLDKICNLLRTLDSIPQKASEDEEAATEQQPKSHSCDLFLRNLVSEAMKSAPKEHKKELSKVLADEKKDALAAAKTAAQGSAEITDDAVDEICQLFQRKCVAAVQKY